MNSFPSITQHCVIEEQDDHLVIALRISKSEIAENIHLLAGLANVVPRENIPARPAPRNWHHLGYAAALFIAILSPSPFGALTTDSFASAMPPVEYRNWHMAKPTFHVGEPIEIVMEYHRNRLCQTSIDRRVVKSGTVNDVVFSTRSYAGASHPNNHFEEFHSTAADHLPPGDYIYSGVTHSECGSGTYDTPHGALAFSVVD